MRITFYLKYKEYQFITQEINSIISNYSKQTPKDEHVYVTSRDYLIFRRIKNYILIMKLV